MSIAAVRPRVACKFQRTPKSSLVSELSSCADVGDAASLRVEHLQQWREAAKREARAYMVWCAASRRDRHYHYLSFLNALRREERAAHQVERDALALAAADPVS